MSYIGYSMSTNAANAYQSGEMPKSKWTKAMILLEIERAGYDAGSFRKIKAEILRDHLLVRSSWHHTGKFYNKTDFWMLDVDRLNEITPDDILEWNFESHAVLPSAKDTGPQAELWECRYLTWGGTRKHPKSEEHTAIGEIRGDWFYLSDGSKKSVAANGFARLRKIDKEDGK